MLSNCLHDFPQLLNGQMVPVDEGSTLTIKAGEAVQDQRHHRRCYANANIPSDLARTCLYATQSPPAPAPNPAGGRDADCSESGGSDVSSSGQPVVVLNDAGQLPTDLPTHNPRHHHHLTNHRPLHQRNFQHACTSQLVPMQDEFSHARSSFSQKEEVSLPSEESEAGSDVLSMFPLHCNGGCSTTNPVLNGCLGTFPPPPAPLAAVDEEDLSPTLTPPTPLAHQVSCMADLLEDRFAMVSCLLLVYRAMLVTCLSLFFNLQP